MSQACCVQRAQCCEGSVWFGYITWQCMHIMQHAALNAMSLQHTVTCKSRIQVSFRAKSNLTLVSRS